jgi:hypothetical protein
MAKDEDEINSEICNLIWQIFDMEPETRENFLKHMDKFEYDEPKQK